MTHNDNPETARLRRKLESDNRHARAEAAVELGRSGAREALPDLEALQHDPDDLVAVAAMFSNWLLGSEEVVVDRAAASLASEEEETVQAAVHAFCEMGDEAVHKLSALIEDEPPFTPQILKVLGDIGGPEALAIVKHAAKSNNQEIASVAREILEDWEDD